MTSSQPDFHSFVQSHPVTLAHGLLRKTEIKIDELLLPYVVDIVIYNKIKEPLLIDHIDRIGIVIYKKQYYTGLKGAVCKTAQAEVDIMNLCDTINLILSDIDQL